MNRRVLFVDDDTRLLQNYQKQLSSHFSIHTYQSGVEALENLQCEEPFAVVICDYDMPGLDGLNFLCKARKIAPHTVRIMLTGVPHLELAVDAINQGDFFRFLIKPCPIERMVTAIVDGIRYHQLLESEKDLLDKTLKGAVRALQETLATCNPLAFQRSQQLTTLAENLARQVKMENLWEVTCAAMLSQIGCITLSNEIVEKKCKGSPLTTEEERQWSKHPETGGRLLAHIPRMEQIAQAITEQEIPFLDATPTPCSLAQLLKISSDFTAYTSRGSTAPQALQQLQLKPQAYNPRFLEALASIIAQTPKEAHPMRSQPVRSELLQVGMRIAEKIHTREGLVVAVAGQEVTQVLKQRIVNFCSLAAMNDSIPIEYSI